MLIRIIRPPHTMSSASISTLQRMSAKALSEKMLQERGATNPTFAVVDVRDDDYLGGHIKGSARAPSQQLDAMMPTLVRKLKDKQIIIFHCALSQQRGPSAALKYMRERDGLLAKLGEDATGGQGVSPQTVCVLDRGFVGWQKNYGEDERLTEAYRKDLWQNY